MERGLSAQDPSTASAGAGSDALFQLAEVLDVPEVQAMMDDFYKLTRIGVGIIDLQGKVLVATGWQEICTQFHRIHPEAQRYCIESDTQLSLGVEPGAFKFYKCKNNLWDIVTPIVVKGRHLGNLFLGQFFFNDEEPDRALFREQARRYGFDEEAYLAALDRVPRWDRETVDTALAFYSRLAEMIARLSYGNFELVKAFEQQRRLFVSLQEGEERFRQFFEGSKNACIIYRPVDDGEDFVIEDMNTAAERIEGVRREVAVGRRVTEVFPGVCELGLFEVFRGVWRDGKARECPASFYHDNRISGWRENFIFRIPQGKVVAVYEDITERKRSEESVRIQAAVLDRLTEGVAYTDLDGVIIFANPAFAAMHGYEPQELVGEHLSIFHTSEQMPAVDAANVELRRRGEWNGEIWHCRRDGSVFPAMMHNVIFRGEDGGALGTIGTMFDITERARREEALRESEAKYRMLFEGANDSIFLVKDERFVDCNSRTLQIFGCTRDQILGQPPYRFSPPRQHDGRDSEEKAKEKMRAAMAGEPQRFEWLHCRHDGTPFDAEISLNRIRLGGEWELQAIVRDITGRKEAERRLQEALAEKEVLLREVHHRVKNNLQVIVSLLDVESGNVSDPAFREAIGAIKARALTMATVHQHLCASEHLSRVELASYLEKLIDMLRASLQKDCSVDVRLEASGVLLPLDSALVVGLIVNELITNAFKYAFPTCPEGGCRIAVRIGCEGERCELVVSDNGVGLPEGFDPKHARSQGLRLVEVLARQLKAEVRIAPRPGTTFTIRFTAGSA